MLYPHWWNGSLPRSLDLEYLLSKKDISIVAFILFQICKMWFIKIQIAYNPSTSIIQLNPKLDALLLKFNFKRHSTNKMEYIINKLPIITRCIHKHNYDKNCETALDDLLSLKKLNKFVYPNDSNF